ncbi:hypothetical protein L7F22_026277 [Adiantum nelumboides]|nr:hypothetical protein [Adiantum nelumboides]
MEQKWTNHGTEECYYNKNYVRERPYGPPAGPPQPPPPRYQVGSNINAVTGVDIPQPVLGQQPPLPQENRAMIKYAQPYEASQPMSNAPMITYYEEPNESYITEPEQPMKGVLLLLSPAPLALALPLPLPPLPPPFLIAAVLWFLPSTSAWVEKVVGSVEEKVRWSAQGARAVAGTRKMETCLKDGRAGKDSSDLTPSSTFDPFFLSRLAFQGVLIVKDLAL